MLAERIKMMQEGRSRRRPWTFTLEAGKGQTYRNGKPTLYGHNVYPSGSVLRGRPERVWLHQWETWEEARAELAKAGLKYEEIGGSSHIDVDTLTAGLDDESS